MPLDDAGPLKELPAAVRGLAERLGVMANGPGSSVRLTQRGRMKRTLGSDSWMQFRAAQSIAVATCDFEWRARFGPLGLLAVCDALEKGAGRLDVTALGFIPIARTAHTDALVRGELMRYLAEIPWAPDAICANPGLRWREDGPDRLIVAAGEGARSAEVALRLDKDGRVASAYAADRPRSATEPVLPTPWRGWFFDYRWHCGRWLPFAGEVAWEIDGREEIYWEGQLESWTINAA